MSPWNSEWWDGVHRVLDSSRWLTLEFSDESVTGYVETLEIGLPGGRFLFEHRMTDNWTARGVLCLNFLPEPEAGSEKRIADIVAKTWSGQTIVYLIIDGKLIETSHYFVRVKCTQIFSIYTYIYNVKFMYIIQTIHGMKCTLLLCTVHVWYVSMNAGLLIG